jgi:two-component system, OmpR family, response regulator
MRTPRNVLLVEDNDDLRELMANVLRREGYEVVCTADGVETEQLLQRGLPELAVVDMMLPGSSGFQVTRLVKELSDGRIPVVMMSGNSSPAHCDYAHAAGADAFLSKPFEPSALREIVARLCPNDRPVANTRPLRAAVIRS